MFQSHLTNKATAQWMHSILHQHTKNINKKVSFCNLFLHKASELTFFSFSLSKGLDQRGPTTLDFQAILQKRHNSQATSNKTMYETTGSQDLKLKKENKWLCHWKYYTITISKSHQWDASGCGFSDNMFLQQYHTLVVQQIRDYSLLFDFYHF